MWSKLYQHHHQSFSNFSIAGALSAERVEQYTIQAPHMRVDLSKNLLDDDARTLLNALAQTCKIEDKRDVFLAGGIANKSENRPALHTLLRRTGDSTIAIPPGLQETFKSVLETRQSILAYAEKLRGNTDVTDVVHIGIGGSYLGPKMVCRALQPLHSTHIRIHFVANIDGHEIHQTLQQLTPKKTLFIVASKSFGTIETLTNAQTAKQWLQQYDCAPEEHMVALTANPEKAQAFGATTIFPFWNWVGGRYSLWSAIGLPIAISIGKTAFTQLLQGAQAMDGHFQRTPIAQNLPIQLGLLDVWYRNICGYNNRCTAPYHSNLNHLVPYLQQLEMESNGKHVDVDGNFVNKQTHPVVFGDVGSDSQHAFFQLLHQGTSVIPLEIIACQKAAHPYDAQHRMLLANAIAQAKALMDGNPSVQGYKHFPGNRPSTFLLLDAMSPQALGSLIALYEHRTFVSSALWNINPFDQFGVELGKTIAKDVDTRLQNGNTDGVDASSAALIHTLASNN